MKTKRSRHSFKLWVCRLNGDPVALKVRYEDGLSFKRVRRFLENKHERIEWAWLNAQFIGDTVAVLCGVSGLYAQIWDSENHFAPVDD